MHSNAALERLINTVMALDGLSESPDYSVEMRCLWRKIDWAATEAETTLKRLTASPPAAQPAAQPGLDGAAA